MSIIKEFLTFEYQNEHVLEHDLSMKKNFSVPKIYTASGDLSKRWYVYFSFRNPKTGKLDRMKNIYGVVNKSKTKEERMFTLSMYRKKLLQLLKKGYNPFEDNSVLQHSQKKPKKTKKEIVEATKPTSMTLRQAFDFALQLKQKMITVSTKRGYESRVNRFLEWMQVNQPTINTIDQLTKGIVIEFLNTILNNTSARNRNNYRVDLGSLFQTLEDNEKVPVNFIKKIAVLKTNPVRNKTYTNEVQEDIFKYLEEKDPLLLLYIKFVSYNFLRPIEVNRLKIGDINLKNKTIQFKAKNSPLKTKIIPDLLLNDLPDISKMKKAHFLFTPEQLGGTWETTEDNKRNYFSKRFKKVVKDHFGLGKDYGLYSFRHTFITKLYRELVKGSSPFDAKSRLMQITGHSSMTALEKYLRDIDAELPEDYSAMLTSKL